MLPCISYIIFPVRTVHFLRHSVACIIILKTAIIRNRAHITSAAGPGLTVFGNADIA